MDNKDSFYKNTFTLTSANITVGVLGFIFSILLSRVLGAEGVGLYNLVTPIYNLFIGLMTAGIIAAISKISAIYSSTGDYSNLFKSLKTFALFNIVWSTIVGLLVFFAAPAIGNMWIKDPRTIMAIRITCPAMICIALSNILKGYFYGVSKITMPAFIDILEKAMRIIIMCLIVASISTKSLSVLVCTGYIALTYGEFQSLVLLYLYFRHSKNKLSYVPNKTENGFQLVFDILIVSLPLCLNAFINNAFSTISALVVPRRLISAGFTYSVALELIGKYSGMALIIANFPIVIITSINTVIIPDLSQTMANNDIFSARHRIKEVLLLSFTLGLATSIVCMLIPGPLGEMFFRNSELKNYIIAASIVTPISFSAMSLFGILNGLSRQNIILRNALLTETLEIVSLFILTGIKSINIYGYAITAIIVNSLSFILNICEVEKVISLKISLTDIVIIILYALFVFFLIKIILPFISFMDSKLQCLIVMLLSFGLLSIFMIKYSKIIND